MARNSPRHPYPNTPHPAWTWMPLSYPETFATLPAPGIAMDDLIRTFLQGTFVQGWHPECPKRFGYRYT